MRRSCGKLCSPPRATTNSTPPSPAPPFPSPYPLLRRGQSNAWLPLWFTFERNATTRAIAQGQYANIRVWRGGLQETVSGPNWVGPAGVEPGSDSGEALTNQWRRPADLLSPNDIRAGEPWLWELPATCFYTVQFLTDLLGAAAPPFGVMTTPVGGTMLEQWSSIATQTQCANITCMCKQKGCDESQPVTAANCPANQNLWLGNVQPFVNITIGLLLWYQVRVWWVLCRVSLYHLLNKRTPHPAPVGREQSLCRRRQLRLWHRVWVFVSQNDRRVACYLERRARHYFTVGAIWLCRACRWHRRGVDRFHGWLSVGADC